ncbi:MAG: DUF1640 domain-containing protein [Caldilineaceae bacterium SB0665_bin_25]|nr:DUF1640 domain-containing protein [Caldilineaceae bacterium SB0665_bin_25]MYD36331.1 DUF1640 domain-containing protein [Dehalococcoidia bacterium]
MTSAFDTLTAARELEASGMERKQAEAVAAAIRAGQGDLATKDDIAGLRRELATLRWMMTITIALVLAILARDLQLLS